VPLLEVAAHMKSPWKYLVQLASLGRTVKEPESPREIAIEEPLGEVDEPIVEAPNEAAGNLDAATVGGERAPTTTVDRSSPDDRVALLEPAGPTRPPPTKRQRRSRKTSASDVAVADAVEYGDSDSSAPQPPMTLADEMTTLDEDIRQLRRRLAEKLLLQNMQLKKMLERFDAS